MPGRRPSPAARTWGFPREFAVPGAPGDPLRIQAFLNATPINHEIGGETVLSVREVIRQRRAHCIEGAMFAACALWVQGEPPLVMHLDCHESDFPHVVALFRRGGAWGAISKTNGAPLRYRDPIYRTLRELAMSYFHEYSNRRGHKTLRSYSTSFDLRRIPSRTGSRRRNRAGMRTTGSRACATISSSRGARSASSPSATPSSARRRRWSSTRGP